MTTIVHKRGTGIPAADDLAVGEIAIDTSTGTAYTKNNSGEVVPVGGGGLPDGERQNILFHNGTDWTATDVVAIHPSTTSSRSQLFINNGGFKFDASSSGGDTATLQFNLYNELTISHPSYGAQLRLQGQSGDPSKLTVNEGFFVDVKADGTIQATDFLDADGNSIIGAGGGGDPDWAKVSNRSTAIGVNANADLYSAALGDGAKANDESTVAIGSSATADRMGAVSIGNDARAQDQLTVAIGMEATATGRGCVAIGRSAQAKVEDSIALGNSAVAGIGEFAISPAIRDVLFNKARVYAKSYLDADGNPATVSPSSIVEAFTTLQTAVADEDTVEGIKTALTNALGGLIEKFEGMSK